MAIPTLGAMIAAIGSPAEWAAVGTSKLYWDNVNGRLGIGTTHPDYDLEVVGTIGINSSATTGYGVAILATSEATPYNILTIHSIGKAGGWAGAINFDISRNAGSAFTAMTIRGNTDGITANVGIGTTTPNQLFEVYGSAPIIRIADSRNLADPNWDNAFMAGLEFWLNDPSTYGTKEAGSIRMIGNVASTGTPYADMAFYTSPTGSTTPTERMRILYNGNVGIGTDAPNALCHVYDATNRGESSAHFVITGSGYSGFHWLDGTAYYIGQNSDSRSLRLYSGGDETIGANLAAGGTSWGTFSDERLKKNITSLSAQLDIVMGIDTVNFNFKTDSAGMKKRIGIVAQSLVGRVDEALDMIKLNDHDETLYYAVKLAELVPVLIKSIQEIVPRIDKLDKKSFADPNTWK